MDKVLLTGAAGFIGSHVVEALLAAGYTVIGVDNFDETLRDAEERRKWVDAMQTAYPRKFCFIEEDIVQSNCVRLKKPDVLVHFAALAGVGPSMAEPTRYVRVNVEATVNLLQQCAEAAVRRVVYASSSSVYGSNTELPFSEADAVEQQSAYASSKRCAEVFADYYARVFGLSIVGLRFFTVYGPRGRPDMAVSKFLRALKTDQPLQLRGDGSSSRDYTWVGDIVDGVLSAMTLTQRMPGCQHELINLGSDNPVELRRLVQLCESATQRRAQVAHTEEMRGDVTHTWASTAKAGQMLGWQPCESLEKGLQKYAQL